MINRHKKVLLFIISVVTIVILFANTISADMGPKPSTTIIIDNPPQNVYYLDLLVENNEQGNYFKMIDDFEDYNKDIVDFMLQYQPDGWHCAMIVGVNTAPIFGDIKGQIDNGKATHKFSYFGTPETYKIIIATEDSKLYISDTIHKQVFQETIHISLSNEKITIGDVDGKTYSEVNVDQEFYLLALAKNILITLIPTLIIEFLVLIIFRIPLKKNIKYFLIVNSITQIVLEIFVNVKLLLNGVLSAYISLIGIEILVFIAETIAYSLLFKDVKKIKAILYSLVANATSLVLGFLLINFII